MSKLDLRKELPLLYRPPSKAVTDVEMPAMRFLMIDGQGDPGGQAYAEAVQALFSVAYSVNFAARTSLRGKHHEIYLSDIRRAAPQKWRTIIRQPMQAPQA